MSYTMECDGLLAHEVLSFRPSRTLVSAGRINRSAGACNSLENPSQHRPANSSVSGDCDVTLSYSKNSRKSHSGFVSALKAKQGKPLLIGSNWFW